jgi:TonB family protein
MAVQAAAAVPARSACERATAESPADPGTSDLCAAEQALRGAGEGSRRERPATGSGLQRARWQRTAERLRRAIDVARSPDVRRLALTLLVDINDERHLDAPKDVAEALRELLRIEPQMTDHVLRLVRLLERQGLWEAAESELLDARRRQPDDPEVYRLLAQFYARRVTTRAGATSGPPPKDGAAGAGEADANGVYRVGGSLTPPARLDVPQYPRDAQAARIDGMVIAEVVIDAGGQVTDARIVRSIPLLDDAALEAVRHWQFAPSIVNGAAVPVRMNVTVNFTLPPPKAPAR